MFEATKPIRGGVVPDWATRLSAIKLAITYEMGTPLPRKEEPPGPDANSDSVAQKLATRPGYRAGVRAYLDFIDRQDAQALAQAKAREAELYDEDHEEQSPRLNPTE